MTYLPTDVFKNILAYCDDRVEQRQRKAKGKVIEFFYRNRQLSDDISGYLYSYDVNNDDDLPIDDLFEEEYGELIEMDRQSTIKYTLDKREERCSIVCEKLNIDKTNKRHIDIIIEVENMLEIRVENLSTAYYNILKHL